VLKVVVVETFVSLGPAGTFSEAVAIAGVVIVVVVAVSDVVVTVVVVVEVVLIAAAVLVGAAGLVVVVVAPALGVARIHGLNLSSMLLMFISLLLEKFVKLSVVASQWFLLSFVF